MPLDQMKVAAVIGKGLNVVCATCENYWDARDRGVPDERCLSTDGCGSPLAGDAFHEYKGPMVRFDEFCFRCGNKATHAVRVSEHHRVVGICVDHIEMMKTLKPVGKRAPNVVLLSKDGDSEIREDDAPPKPVIKFR